MLSSPLASLSTKELQLRFQEAFGQATPSRNRPWLLKRLAATPTPAASDQAVPVNEEPSPTPESAAVTVADMPPSVAPAVPAAPAAPLTPQVGTEIRRTWRGQELVVSVQADGFHLNGTVYRSLSAAASALCGGNRNGLVFFGLKPHRRRVDQASP